MPQPSDITAVNRPDLGYIAYEIMTDAEQSGFIGSKVMPVFMTGMQTAQYPIMTIEQLLKIVDVERAPGSAYNEDDWDFDFGHYSTNDRGRAGAVDDRQAKMYSRYFDAEAVTTKRLVNQILRAQESRVAVLTNDTANAVGNAAVSTIWTTYASADPAKDVLVAAEAMRSAGGLYPNTVVLTKTALIHATLTAAFKSATQYTSGLLEMSGWEAKRQMVSAWFGMNVLVADGIKDTAKKGQAATIARIWTDSKVNLLHIGSATNDLEQPTFGRTFVWDQESTDGVLVETYRNESKRANMIRVRQDTDEKVVTIGANYILTGAV